MLIYDRLRQAGKKHGKGIDPRHKWKRSQREFSSGSRTWKWFLYMTWNIMKWHEIISVYHRIYIIYIFVSRFYKQMSTSKHVFHAELPVGNPQWFFPISRVTCQKSRARRPIFLVFEPSSSHGRSRGVLWGFLGDSLWPCDSLHPGEKPWITDAMWYGIFQALDYRRLMSGCSHAHINRTWNDGKIERSKKEHQWIVSNNCWPNYCWPNFFGVERLNLERNPG